MPNVSSDEEEETMDFFEMGLDDRILKAITLLGWNKPTLIQEKAIPLALQGNDILAKARTRSGKTAVFAIPVIDKILKYKQANTFEQRKTHAIIVAPSKELCHQLKEHISKLTQCCLKEIRCVDVAYGELYDIKPLLAAVTPEIIVGTPAKILAHIQAGSLANLKNTVTSFVVDEADLLFSFGFEDDMQKLIDAAIPKKGCQCYLVSATLNPELINLKNLVLHKPVIIKLEEAGLAKRNQKQQLNNSSSTSSPESSIEPAILDPAEIRRMSMSLVRRRNINSRNYEGLYNNDLPSPKPNVLLSNFSISPYVESRRKHAARDYLNY